MELLCRLVDVDLCGRLEISSDYFQNVMLSLIEDADPGAHYIVQTLEKACDFMEFRSQMIEHNIRIECKITRSLLDFGEQHPEIEDPNTVSASIAETVQASEDEDFQIILDKTCRQVSVFLPLPFEKELKPERYARADEMELLNADVDAEEVMRRKRYWVKQRELLLREEEKLGRRKVVPPANFAKSARSPIRRAKSSLNNEGPRIEQPLD
jgi:hypothetical protein